MDLLPFLIWLYGISLYLFCVVKNQNRAYGKFNRTERLLCPLKSAVAERLLPVFCFYVLIIQRLETCRKAGGRLDDLQRVPVNLSISLIKGHDAKIN